MKRENGGKNASRGQRAELKREVARRGRGSDQLLAGMADDTGRRQVAKGRKNAGADGGSPHEGRTRLWKKKVFAAGEKRGPVRGRERFGKLLPKGELSINAK